MAYDAKKIYYRFDDHLSRLVLDYEASRQISSESESLYHGLPTDPYDEGLFEEHNVKRGLRNADGSGVVAGLTRISDVHGYNKVDGKVVPDQGKLTLRGYSIEDLVNNAQAENRYGYEEVAYLLITGSLPNKEELDGFCERLGAFRHLSDEYVKEFPMTTVSSSIMNVLHFHARTSPAHRRLRTHGLGRQASRLRGSRAAPYARSLHRRDHPTGPARRHGVHPR